MTSLATPDGLVCAVDIGGSSLRAALVASDGEIAALASRPHRMGEEADATIWWHALLACLAELDLARARGLAITGVTRTQVLSDASGMPTRPAQCFSDGRPTAEAAELAGTVDGTWTEMTPYHPLARLRWAERHDPAAYARSRFVLQPKDWLALRLTGIAASDPVANAWTFRQDGKSCRPHHLMPPILNPAAPVGVTAAGMPVFMASMDTWCATIGTGAAHAGGAYLVSGTSDAAGAFDTAPRHLAGRVTLPWGDGLFHTGGPSNAGGDTLAWAADILGLDGPAQLAALATEAGDPPLFLPYLTGERVPLWRADARGAFLGLSRGHGRAEMARAVLEGVATADRDILDGLDFGGLVISGGGARSDFWCQVRADALGRPVTRTAHREPSLVGAAAMVWTGLGRYGSLREAQAAMARTDRVFAPRPNETARLDAVFSRFKQAQAVCLYA